MVGLRAVVVALTLALLGASAAQAADLEKSSIRLAVGGKTLVAYLPLTIAERRGYFTKEGLEGMHRIIARAHQFEEEQLAEVDPADVAAARRVLLALASRGEH